MAKKETIKKEVEEVKAEVKKASKKIEGLSIFDARKELQSLIIRVKTGEDKNTSQIKKIKQYIARELTKINKK